MGFLAAIENIAMFPCQDPRLGLGDRPRTNSAAIGISIMKGSKRPLRFDTKDHIIEEGHYMLYLFGNTSFVT